MFNLQEAYSNVSLDDIFSRVSEEELWRYYCPNFKEINKSFKSEFYNDKNPSCRVFIGNKGLVYKDLGNGESYGIISYLQKKYTSTFKEVLNIMATDFNIKGSNVIKPNSVEKVKYYDTTAFKTIIEVIPQGYTIADYKYWGQYGISLELLEEEEIISCKSIYLTTINGVFRYDYNVYNPIYAFKEYDIDLNFLGYKIYFPLAEKGKKWINSSSDKAIQGIKATISNDSDLIILSKARKDCICYKLLGIKAIAPYNETSNLDINGISNFLNTFPRKLVNYDNDERGINESLQIKIKYGYDYFFVSKEKDLSDYIKKYGLEKAKRMIDKKIKEL